MENQVDADRKKRSSNWDSSEISLLRQLVEQNLTIIRSKLTNAITNAQKTGVWKTIACQINARGLHCSLLCEKKWRKFVLVRLGYMCVHNSATLPNLTTLPNSEFSRTGTGKEVKTKWQNLQSKAKTQYAEKNKYSKQTGGGPAPKPMSNETEKIVEMMKDCSSFVGLNGCESSVILVTSEGAYSFLFKFSDRVALKVKNKGTTHSNSLNFASADQYL
ncbi:Hypothetical predicted protein [Mytilus galloprovincialis]|uniref:Myb/SANT-like DNA-binding domain-containing protein n=1 Tax=Mytilus galloprovincialis TaxID=29158 RepID=A0A8B6CSV5_MYTGA|nr:Hypothetical predicted protein [Mytilus galloprovincialis]